MMQLKVKDQNAGQGPSARTSCKPGVHLGKNDGPVENDTTRSTKNISVLSSWQLQFTPTNFGLGFGIPPKEPGEAKGKPLNPGARDRLGYFPPF